MPLSASYSSGQHFACGFLQIPPRDGHPCRSANISPCRVCRGLTPHSHSADHHSQSSCAFAQRTMLGAQKNAPEQGNSGAQVLTVREENLLRQHMRRFSQRSRHAMLAFCGVIINWILIGPPKTHLHNLVALNHPCHIIMSHIFARLIFKATDSISPTISQPSFTIWPAVTG